MKKIKILNQNLYALVDNEDYQWLKKYTWYSHNQGYITTAINNKTLLIHRLIMKPKDGLIVDHINQNKLDNRKSNLRIGTQSQNLANQKKKRGTSSIYKGVSFDKSRDKWQSKIRIAKKMISLGRFKEERHAAMAYDIWAKDYYGEFARLNFKEPF